MENIRKHFEKELKNLEINDENEITVKLIEKKFKRKALKVHSDKTGNADDEEFKELVNDYNRVREAVKKLSEESQGKNEDEETDMSKFFEKHNLAKEFSQSWTIYIEKDKVDDWSKEMTKLYPENRKLQGNGTQFKAVVDEKIVSTTLYDVQIPKMNIQGNHNSIRKFVINILPEIYKRVCIISDSISSSEQVKKVPLKAKFKITGETIFTCDICDKTYVRKTAMKKHMQIKHTPAGIKQMLEMSKHPIALPSIQTCSISNISKDDDSNETEDERNHGNSKETEIIEDENENTATIVLEETAEVVEDSGPVPIDTNWQCGECGNVANTEDLLMMHMSNIHKSEESSVQISNNIEATKDVAKSIEKELETLQRRHDQLKEKYEEAIKNNKEYAKTLFDVLKENAQLKATAESDSETLNDTLSINQVLVEELKVKDKIIEANELLNKNKDNKENEEEQSTNSAQCTKCPWTSNKKSQLAGHMLKHTGQYICDVCKSVFKTKNELNKHKDVEHSHPNETAMEFNCITCDKKFRTEPSFKQHLHAKHKNQQHNLPVGHPDRNRSRVSSQCIACRICDETFATGNALEEHMGKHRYETRSESENGFINARAEKSCRYYKNGFCVKGDQCAFKHEETQRNTAPACNRGQECFYFYQNRCRYYHPGVGVQNQNKEQFRRPRECRYKSECWNQSSCSYGHPGQDFQFSQRTSRPPQGVRNMEIWRDY